MASEIRHVMTVETLLIDLEESGLEVESVDVPEYLSAREIWCDFVGGVSLKIVENEHGFMFSVCVRGKSICWPVGMGPSVRFSLLRSGGVFACEVDTKVSQCYWPDVLRALRRICS